MGKFSLPLLCSVASIFKRNIVRGSYVQGSHLHSLNNLLSSTIVDGISSPDSDAINSHQRQEVGYQNLILNNTSLDGGSTQDSYLHNLDKNRKVVLEPSFQ